jgi:iron complex outermembrane receptor protein
MHRNYLQAGDAYQYGQKASYGHWSMYSDLDYQTPGGLNLAQMQADPRSARLPTPTLPGAIDQKIRINTKILLGGLVNDAQLTDRVVTYWPFLATM